MTYDDRTGSARPEQGDIGPAIGSAWQSPRPGQPRPMDAGTFALVTLPTSPFWARRYTRFFLDSCRGISEGTAETAELLVSELVTNAVRFAGDPARTLRYSERANASLISLSCGISARACSSRFTTPITIRQSDPVPMTMRKTAGASCSSMR